MPTEADRKEFETAMRNKDFSKFRELLQRNDAKELLLMGDEDGCLPIHDACVHNLDTTSLQLILDTAVEHGIIKKMLETKDNLYGRTCLYYACYWKLSFDSLRLLLEYVSKYTDIKKMLEDKIQPDQTCLHTACYQNLSINSLRLLISFFPSKETFENARAAKDYIGDTPVDCVEAKEIKQLLQDPNCFEKCRLWLLQNHESTFICSLYPNSFEKTCEALKELSKNGLQHSQQHATIMLIALMSSASEFREAIDNTDSSAPMSSYLSVVKKGDKKSDYDHWRKNFNRFREFYGQWPPSERKTASTYEGEGEDSSSCVIQ